VKCAQQVLQKNRLNVFQKHLNQPRLLTLTNEEDIKSRPISGMKRPPIPALSALFATQFMTVYSLILLNTCVMA